MSDHLRRFPAAAAVSVLSGLLLACAYPPVGLGFIAFIACVPVLAVVYANGSRTGFLYAWLTGIVFLAATVFWIKYSTWAGMVFAVIVLGGFFALPFSIAAYVSRVRFIAGLAVFPFAVAAVEWIRSFDQLAFPWMILGNSQSMYPGLVQFADITSVFGVSAWVAAVNATAYYGLVRRRVHAVVLLALMFLLPFLYSQWRMSRIPEGGSELTVALIQGNVSPLEKWRDGLEEWNIRLYASMSAQAARYNPDLIVWPETAIPAYFADIPSYREMVQSEVDSLGIPVLTGTPSIDFGTNRTWNSAALVVPGGNEIERYHKIHLVPFGEAFPMDSYFPVLRTFDFGQANWDEGDEIVIFEPPDVQPFTTAICFESIFPDLIRSFVVRGATFITIVTNDVWFAPVAAPEQHAMIAVMRAVEHHKPVARCANMGITLFIDPWGRITKRTEINERAVLVDTIESNTGTTFYARYGNVFSSAALIITLFSMFIRYLTGRRNPQEQIGNV